MNFSLETLEFARLLEIVARGAQTPMGRSRVARLGPFHDLSALATDLAAISEAMSLFEKGQASWSFSGVEDPSDAIAVLKIGGATLDPESMLALGGVCRQAISARSSIKPHSDDFPVLWKIVESAAPALGAVIDKINRCILPGGEIDDSASAELGRIRRDINAQRTRLTKSLESAMRGAGDAIQDAIVTIRNDRYVIPVKSDFRGKVGGVAHGFSSSGATVFVEPLDAIEANNELQNLKGKEEREIACILFGLSEELRLRLPEIEAAAEVVAELDFVGAKVRFARSFKAVVPEISDSAVLDLVDARHPLLEENLRENAKVAASDHNDGEDSSAIVPVSFSLSPERPVMIISGANAGGKTVVLKTAGLLALMAISGLPVPAKSAKLPFYRSVLADIGDHQSLAANLSTFSSHMSNIARMMNQCVAPALVLLDEAGTGTDPEEGSALGVAIVDHFRHRCNAQVIASTHYRGLKIYAASDAGVVNASVEFDQKTLRPTYRLLLGLAGASSGIEIAGRFGIEPRVIEAARAKLDAAAREAEEYLQKLQFETRRVEDLRAALDEERGAVAMKFANLEIEAGKKERARQKEFEAELAAAVSEFERQSKAFIKSIEDKALRNRLEKERESRKAELNRAVVNKLQPSARGTRSDAPAFATSPAGGDSSAESAAPGDEIAVGGRVVTSFGNIGTVEKIDRQIAEVLVGGMRLREKLSDLRPAAGPPTGQSRGEKMQNSAAALNFRLDAPDAATELNLIGKTTAEAEYELDRFVDEAYLASVSRIRIIHGFGTGALKNFVHHFLKNHDLIEKFGFASPENGGHGATVAELKL